MKHLVFSLFFIISLSVLKSENLDENYFFENYSFAADRIVKAAMHDTNAYNRLGYLCDVFGPRLSGSDNLNKAIDWILSEFQMDSLSNAHKDTVLVPFWTRGEEYLELVSPYKIRMPMISLGGSVGTVYSEDAEFSKITADVFVVKSFDDLKENKDQIKGKILLYNMPFDNYGQAVQYRFYGAVEAAKYGAVASMIRSVTPAHNRSVHAGMMTYKDAIKKIPHIAITPEDSYQFQRLQDRGITPRITLYMEAQDHGETVSYNTMAELPGREKPEEILAIGGHIDSWDAGHGAQDDAGGCVSTWAAVKLLKDLNLIPRRTIRVVMWTNEENGQKGGPCYANKYNHQPHVLMFESDSGIWEPLSLNYTGPEKYYNTLKAAEPLLKKISPKLTIGEGGGGVDIRPMMQLGVPGMSIRGDSHGKYFHYHHSHLDTFDKIDLKAFNQNIAAIALAIFIYADLPIDLKEKYYE